MKIQQVAIQVYTLRDHLKTPKDGAVTSLPQAVFLGG